MRPGYEATEQALVDGLRDRLAHPMIKRAKEALEIAADYGQYDGAYHKMWVIDQIVRTLTGDEYDAWVEDYCDDGEYEWDTGVAP
jgi:hypothetical protein